MAYLGSSPRVLDSVAAEHLLTGSIECAATALAATLIVAAGPRHEQQGSIPEPQKTDEPQNAGVEESCLRRDGPEAIGHQQTHARRRPSRLRV